MASYGARRTWRRCTAYGAYLYDQGICTGTNALSAYPKHARMQRLLASTMILALTVAACAPRGAQPSANRGGRSAGESVSLHEHQQQQQVQVSIGEVRALDAGEGTIGLAIAHGKADERAGRGPVRTFAAAPTLRARVRIGDVIEFRSRAAEPYPQILTIDRHIHGKALGLPEDTTAR